MSQNNIKSLPLLWNWIKILNISPATGKKYTSWLITPGKGANPDQKVKVIRKNKIFSFNSINGSGSFRPSLKPNVGFRYTTDFCAKVLN